MAIVDIENIVELHHSNRRGPSNLDRPTEMAGERWITSLSASFEAILSLRRRSDTATPDVARSILTPTEGTILYVEIQAIAPSKAWDRRK